MTVERQAGFFESIRSGVNPLSALGGERVWRPFVDRQVVKREALITSSNRGGYWEDTRILVAHEVVPESPDAILNRVQIVSWSIWGSIRPKGISEVSQRSFEERVSNTDINDPKQRWHGKVRWVATKTSQQEVSPK